MELSELVRYARDKYGIQEQHKWSDFPGFSVLCHPKTGKWAALLMRQWDSETGTQLERCDLKCGRESLPRFRKSFLTQPVRMHGKDWIGVIFDRTTEEETVFGLFDQAVAAGNQAGFTIVLPERRTVEKGGYHETPLPFAGMNRPKKKEAVPERLREMKRLFEYGSQSASSRAENFYRQALFMQDYEDEVPWTGSFVCYFPTYHDMTTQQLRGYFTWRTHLRRGKFEPISSSAAYVYIYELLNGIGADSAEESLRKMQEFEEGFLESGLGDARMRANLHRWMMEFAVLHGLPREMAQKTADREMLERDTALSVLRTPDRYTDDEVFSALSFFGGKKIASSPVLKVQPERGKHLFCEAWRAALSDRGQQEDAFSRCFGGKVLRRWYPLANTVYYHREKVTDREYVLDECRRFLCSNGAWQMEAYEKPSFDRYRFQGFCHGTDLRLRRYLKTGRYLREAFEDEWAAPYAEAAIEADRKALLEAARPKITIDLSGLDQIRRDASVTRESLLTEEDRREYEEEQRTADLPEQETVSRAPEENTRAASVLNEIQIQILRTLLEAGDVSEILRKNHLMPSLAADAINEALFDEFGDTVLISEDNGLFLVDDYTEDLKEFLGGNSNE